jgi:D-alanine-D-alanine ligase-like ATP-grasp enzyme
LDIYADIVPVMKSLILKSFYAVRKTIDPQRHKYCFEMFGYDFILDEDFNTWLIEVNTNPCLEESSQLLKDMLPRMIEDMFKLTID